MIIYDLKYDYLDFCFYFVFNYFKIYFVRYLYIFWLYYEHFPSVYESAEVEIDAYSKHVFYIGQVLQMLQYKYYM